MKHQLLCLHIALVSVGVLSPCSAQERVRLSGSSTLALAMKEAAPVLKKELGIEVQFGDLEAGSTAALRAIGLEMADIAMVTRPLTQADRSTFASKRYFDIDIGTQALVPIVPREVWDAGVRSIKQ